jgi:tRNA U38,U39,U40 pseudouridine synthase TruA
VTDTGIATLKALTNLADLDLDSAGVTDAGIDALQAHASLKVLNLYHTLVTEKGYAKLKTGLPECRIVWDRDSSMPNRRGS